MRELKSKNATIKSRNRFEFLLRDMLHKARYCREKSSVNLSVRLQRWWIVIT